MLPEANTVAFLPHDNVTLGIKRALGITRLTGTVITSLFDSIFWTSGQHVLTEVESTAMAATRVSYERK